MDSRLGATDYSSSPNHRYDPTNSQSAPPPPPPPHPLHPNPDPMAAMAMSMSLSGSSRSSTYAMTPQSQQEQQLPPLREVRAEFSSSCSSSRRRVPSTCRFAADRGTRRPSLKFSRPSPRNRPNLHPTSTHATSPTRPWAWAPCRVRPACLRPRPPSEVCHEIPRTPV